jgi:hypothetical protein
MFYMHLTTERISSLSNNCFKDGFELKENLVVVQLYDNQFKKQDDIQVNSSLFYFIQTLCMHPFIGLNCNIHMHSTMPTKQNFVIKFPQEVEYIKYTGTVKPWYDETFSITKILFIPYKVHVLS